MNARTLLRSVLIVLCLVVTAASVMNVFVDNEEVRALAEKTGCGAAAPTCAMTRMERTPLHQSFEFVSKKETAEVVCTRSAILFGAYTCAREGNGG